MNSDRVILKVNGNYYHKHLGGNRFDVREISPESYSIGHFKDNGGAYLSLYNQMGAYQGRVSTGKLQASQINGVWLWDADALGKEVSVEPRGQSAAASDRPSVVKQLRPRPPACGGQEPKPRRKATPSR